MAAPKHAPVSPTDDSRGYASPPHVPGAWMPNRPAEIHGFQPEGGRLGYQGPDQGFGLRIANTFRGKLHLTDGESENDVIRGGTAIALRRASMFSRAPVVHDFTVAFTAWGFLGANPPAGLLDLRRRMFDGVGNAVHHYFELRALVDMVPEATLRMTPQSIAAAYPGQWRELLAADVT